MIISGMAAWIQRSSEAFLHAGTVRLACSVNMQLDACNDSFGKGRSDQRPRRVIPRCQIRKVVEMELDCIQRPRKEGARSEPQECCFAFPVPPFPSFGSLLCAVSHLRRDM
jgi:hypothetical protein